MVYGEITKIWLRFLFSRYALQIEVMGVFRGGIFNENDTGATNKSKVMIPDCVLVGLMGISRGYKNAKMAPD